MMMRNVWPTVMLASFGTIATIAVSQPVQALTIGSGNTVTLGGNVVIGGDPLIDFRNNSVGPGNLTVTSGTGGFSSLVNHNGLIRDLSPTVFNLINPASFLPQNNLLRIYAEKPSDGNPNNDVFFSLTQYLPPYTDQDIIVAGRAIDRYTISFKGKFSGAVDGVTDGIATFQADFSEGAIGNVYNALLQPNRERFEEDEDGPRARGPWSVTIVADKKIPTPALLPGIIGLGFSAWRKRRSVG
jgi:hypothetical protein